MDDKRKRILQLLETTQEQEDREEELAMDAGGTVGLVRNKKGAKDKSESQEVPPV